MALAGSGKSEIGRYVGATTAATRVAAKVKGQKIIRLTVRFPVETRCTGKINEFGGKNTTDYVRNVRIRHGHFRSGNGGVQATTYDGQSGYYDNYSFSLRGNVWKHMLKGTLHNRDKITKGFALFGTDEIVTSETVGTCSIALHFTARRQGRKG